MIRRLLVLVLLATTIRVVLLARQHLAVDRIDAHVNHFVVGRDDLDIEDDRSAFALEFSPRGLAGRLGFSGADGLAQTDLGLGEIGDGVVRHHARLFGVSQASGGRNACGQKDGGNHEFAFHIKSFGDCR